MTYQAGDTRMRVCEERLSPATIAQRLDVSPATVNTWIRRGLLRPVERLPSGEKRVRASIVDKFMAQMSKAPAGPRVPFWEQSTRNKPRSTIKEACAAGA